MSKTITDQIAELHTNGTLVKEIAKRVGLSLKAVEWHIRKLIRVGRITRRAPVRNPPASAELLAKIRKLFIEEKRPASEVGDLLGMNRNQVLGICYRNGIRRPENITRAARKRAVGRWAGGDSIPIPMGGGKELALIGAHDCRYPMGEPGKAGFRFCGERVHEGRPYCPYHSAKCYRPREAA